ncbi:MAG TPA: GNAT family N-acetyltransferase, partial [Streptomyces sp.]|nr:GNAT family N-acetyltransferase [Streptomyces sp.]
FYTAMGAVRVGAVPSGSVPGRMLPLLELALT